MVAFILRPDSPEIPPPYEFPGIRMFSFRLPAKLSKLQKLCDDWLNIGTLFDRGFEYRAFLPFVDMELLTYPKMEFAEAPYSNWGFASQQELYFRFFVWRFVYAGGIMLPVPTPELFFPYLFVDNSWSMISGRNVIGFPKVMARFERPSNSAGTPFPIVASTLVLATHQPTTHLDWRPFVTINSGGGSTMPIPAGAWPWIELATTDPLFELLLEAFEAALPEVFSTVQLKQFRDAPSVTGACYQAIVSTPFSPSKIGNLEPLPAATVTIKSYASLDIPKALGIPANTPITPALQYSVELDMKMVGATNLFVNG